MKPSSLQEASFSVRSTAPGRTGSLQSVTASLLPLTRAAVEIDATVDHTSDASIGINTCGWYEGTAVTCASPSACGFSSTFRACCVDQACSSSVFNTACLPYDDEACLAGTPGPATKCCTDTSSPACQTLFWPTSPGAPDQTVFTLVDWCAPISQAGQGIVVTTPPPQASNSPPPQDSGSSSLLKPPAGTILETFLGAAVIFVLVIITCVIIARKVHAARTRALGGDTSRSSLTVSAFLEQPGQNADIPLSTRPGITRAAEENKMHQPQTGDIQRGLEVARV